jgi:hypothetical protein
MHVFANAQFHLVVYTLFLLDKGFSTQQFFIIESGYYLVTLFMELPTGVLSDRVSRKWSLVAASLVGIPLLPTIILSASFWVVLAAMAVDIYSLSTALLIRGATLVLAAAGFALAYGPWGTTLSSC